MRRREGAVPHPVVWGVLFLPFGATSGYVSVTLAFVGRQRGLSDGAIAGLVATSTLPQVWKFFWAPIADMTWKRRSWHFFANLVSSATLVAVGLAPLGPGSVGSLKALILVNGLAVSFLGMATEGLLAHTATSEQRGRASGWFQAGNLGGVGIGGGLALALATRIGMAGAAVALCVGLLCCSLPLLRIGEPVREQRGSAARAVSEVGRDLWRTVLASRTGVLALILCFLPVGAAAASSLFAAIADRWGTSSDTVALLTGLVAGVVSAAGCLAGGWLSDAMDRKVAYSLTGFGLAAVAAGMWVAPRTPVAFGAFTLLYNFCGGVAFGAFTGFALEVIGKGAAATKYNALASLSNLPIYYMTLVDGWASDRWGAGGMLLMDAATEIAGAVAFLGLAMALVGWRPGSPSGFGSRRSPKVPARG